MFARCASLAGLLGALLALASSCSSKRSSGAAPPASASAGEAASEGPSESAAAPAEVARPAPPAPPAPRERDEQVVEPLYPQAQEPPDPAAQRYCDLVHEAAERKRQECCPAVPSAKPRPTAECVRTLSYALGVRAVALEQADLDACEAAILEEAAHCDWGGSMPRACIGIIRGQTDYMSLCRSSLECKEGLYCAGLSAAAPGKCRSAQQDGMPCGATADPLAELIRQDPEQRNPKCAGYCFRRRCATAVSIGEACVSPVECGRDRSCMNGRCTDAPLPAAGAPCRQKQCGAGLVCVKGICAALRRIGEPCEMDTECRSTRCEHTEGGPGRCAVVCQSFRPKAVQLTGN